MPIHYFVMLQCEFCGMDSAHIPRRNAEPPVREFDVPSGWFYEDRIPSALANKVVTSAVLCPKCLELVKRDIVTGQRDPR